MRSTRTQLDGTLATAAKVTGQNLQAIGTATGNVTGKQPTPSPAPGTGLEPLSYYFSPARLIPDLDNLVPDPWTHLLSTESKAFILGGPRFLLRHYDGEGIVADPGDAVPAWTTKYVTGTKFAGLGVSILNQALETYSEGEAEHWSTGKLWAETIGQGVVIGGTSGASSWWAGNLVSPSRTRSPAMSPRSSLNPPSRPPRRRRTPRPRSRPPNRPPRRYRGASRGRG